jgi:hypothetical protein
LRDEEFSCSLDVLYGGPGISKLQFLIKKIKKIFSCKFFPIFEHQNPGSGSRSSLTKNAGSGSGSALQHWPKVLTWKKISNKNTHKNLKDVSPRADLGNINS